MLNRMSQVGPGGALSYTSGSSSTSISNDTIAQRLSVTVAGNPDGVALISRHQQLRQNWTEFQQSCEQAARALLAAGVEKGDRVGIWSPTCAEWTWLQFATAQIGAILVNVNPAYRANELAFALQQSGVRLLVIARSFRTADYLDMLASVRHQLPDLERVVTIGEDRASGGADLCWAEFLNLGASITQEALAQREDAIHPDHPVNIQYTSGTTGNPKGATLTHRNILNNGLSLASLLGYTAADRVCIPVPLYHCFGMGIGNLGCIAAGATMVYPAEAFEPLATLEAIAEERCTSIYGVPTMFITMLEHADFASFDLTSLRTGIMAGAPCPIEVMKRVVDEMHASDICIAYGMTETSPVSFMSRPDDALDRRVSTVGTAMPHVESKVVDPTSGATIPRGTPGEICTRGYLVMRGYWGDPVGTAQVVDADGWMHTGDLGVLDQDGYLNIVGRAKDLVIRGGENIYPKEIEDLLFGHPAIASAQVIGVPDERMGEELMAWVALKDGAQLSSDELQAWCRERVSRFKVPRYVKFTDEFPMTVTGKVQKFKMRQLAVAELGLSAADGITTA
jgi:fatty-acyl-CoA synthase